MSGLLTRFHAAARAFRQPGRPTPRPPSPSLAALERPVTDVVASQAVFEVIGWHLQDAAEAGRNPTNRERLAYVYAAAELGRAVDRLAMAYNRATAGQGGAL